MGKIRAVGDRLVGTVVPKAVARAQQCSYFGERCYCRGGIIYTRYCRICTGGDRYCYTGCIRTGNC